MEVRSLKEFYDKVNNFTKTGEKRMEIEIGDMMMSYLDEILKYIEEKKLQFSFYRSYNTVKLVLEK